MIVDKKTNETLMMLISTAGVMRDDDLEEALEDSKTLDLPLDRAIFMSGRATESALEQPLEAMRMIQNGQVTMGIAIAALRLEPARLRGCGDRGAAIRAARRAGQLRRRYDPGARQ